MELITAHVVIAEFICAERQAHATHPKITQVQWLIDANA
jgi:hypothetical protein